MKTKMIKNIKPIILALVVVLGVGYVSADWTVAPANPPSDNVPAPINVGGIEQTKTGNFKVIPGVFTASHIFTDDLVVTTGNPVVGQVLTAADTNGTAVWGPAGGNASGVTQIIAGTDITINPSTGVGNVTINADSLIPVEVGVINKGVTKNFGANWRMIHLSGQYDPGSGSDSSPAGGYIMKSSTGIVTWAIYIGQRKIQSGNGSQVIDALANGASITITAPGATGVLSVTANRYGTQPDDPGVQLTYVMYN